MDSKFSVLTNNPLIYQLKNPQKYLENIDNIDIKKIKYFHNKELPFLKEFDENKNVIFWGYKVLNIPYFNLITNELEDYYPSFYYFMLEKNNIVEYLLDIDDPIFFPDFDLNQNYTDDEWVYINNITEQKNQQKEKYENTERYCRLQNIHYKLFYNKVEHEVLLSTNSETIH